MKHIPLTKGHSALIDDEDFHRLVGYSWFVIETVTGGNIHICPARWSSGSYPNRRCIRMAYDVLQSEVRPGLVIDHIDRNPLNNQKENLRWVSRQENAANSDRVINAKGVYYDKKRNRYKAFYLSGNSFVRRYLGTFKQEAEALQAVADAKAGLR